MLISNYVDVGEDSNENCDDDDVRGIRFKDSEEERAGENNKGFVVMEVDQPHEGNKVEINGRKYRYKLKRNKDGSTIRSSSKIRLGVPQSVMAESSRMGGKPTNSRCVEQDGDYGSEELGSLDPDDSVNERMSKYEKFRGDLLNKDYEFKLGMKFNSLVEFKDSIRDLSVLNGREINFV